MLQFEEGVITDFNSYSKYPPCFKDMTFWCPDGFHENDLFEVVRDVAGDLVETVDRIDDFTHPKTGRHSQCYRITYRSMDRNLVNEEVDDLQWEVRDRAVAQLQVELR
jgi:phenylalanyl-tRNA synthetase alpha chain